jgi:hypothetical protein
MCDDQVQCSQIMSQSVATRLPQIVLWRVEEMFPGLKGSTVSVLCMKGIISVSSLMIAVCSVFAVMCTETSVMCVFFFCHCS